MRRISQAQICIFPNSTLRAGQAHEDLDKVAILHEDAFGPGQSRTVNFTFKQPASAGTLEFECSYPGHYEQGMHIPITIEQ